MGIYIKVLIRVILFSFRLLGLFLVLRLLGLLLGLLGLAIFKYGLNEHCGVEDHTLGYPTMCSNKPITSPEPSNSEKIMIVLLGLLFFRVLFRVTRVNYS